MCHYCEHMGSRAEFFTEVACLLVRGCECRYCIGFSGGDHGKC